MHFCDVTLPTGAENVALDEALLDEAEAAPNPREFLRLWEPARPIVVIGRSSRYEIETRPDDCRNAGVPIIRRTSGGAAIVTGSGCLMYAVVLSLQLRPELRAIDAVHRFVLSRFVSALVELVPSVAECGTSDLACAVGDARPDIASPASTTLATHRAEPLDFSTLPRLRKFSGNSLRVKRRHVLYHGTLLYDFDLTLVERYLAHPPREPAYRAGRPHSQFITNLPVAGAALRAAVLRAWPMNGELRDWPRERTARLSAKKYSQDAWNLAGQVTAE